MSYTGEFGNLVPLVEKNGAVRHEDEKLKALIVQAVTAANEERDNKAAGDMKSLLDRFERSFERMTTVVEGFALGERATAVAGMIDGPDDDLPSVSRIKAEPSAIYIMTTKTIAEALGLSTSKVSFLLNQGGLNWVERHPDLWDRKAYETFRRRAWHPKTTALLRKAIMDETHGDRIDLSEGCERMLQRCKSDLLSL